MFATAFLQIAKSSQTVCGAGDDSLAEHQSSNNRQMRRPSVQRLSCKKRSVCKLKSNKKKKNVARVIFADLKNWQHEQNCRWQLTDGDRRARYKNSKLRDDLQPSVDRLLIKTKRVRAVEDQELRKALRDEILRPVDNAE